MRKQRLLIVLSAVMVMLILLNTTALLAQTTQDPVPPVLGEFDPASISEIDPANYPILPELTDFARVIFERGQQRDVPRNPHMFSKVGDSMTASEHFLVPFGAGDYDLGDFPELQPVVDYFTSAADVVGNSAFNRANYANALGFSTASALDSTWAVAEVCEPNESPLACEYRVSNAAFALIMFGTNDVIAFDESLFDFFLRSVILETIHNDVVPVLYTMPIRPEAPGLSEAFNQIVLTIAADWDLPVINLVVALEHLPNFGVDLEDTLHLTLPEAPATAATFTEAGLAGGYTVRNLVTLQALDALLTGLNLLPSEN